MKNRIITTLLTTTLLLTIVGVFATPVIHADSTDQYGYSFSCEKFEVDEITNDGKFSNKGCYLDIDSAKSKMRENENYVVRYVYGRSPMRIVAMNSGLVYAYPNRSGDSTINVYEDPDENKYVNKVSTYTNTYQEMVYYDTTFVNSSGPTYGGYGILKVSLNGFEGYTDLELVDLIPFKFIDNEIPCYTGANSSSAKKFILRQNYFVAKKNGSYTDLCINTNRSEKHPSANDSTQSGEYSIGVAPSFMNLGQHYYSKDGINFYSDNHYKNYVGTNYNYFQFLSLRSKANVTADQLKSYLNKQGRTNSAYYNQCQAFIDAQNTYGMNALLIFALACNESAYGTSEFAIYWNNLFGLGAYDSNPSNAKKFNSVADCINSLEGYNLAQYCDYYTNTGYYTAPYFGNKGVGISLKYASDPYECYKIAGLAYNIDKYISGNNGQLTNYNAYNLALVKDSNVDFKAQANPNSATLYKSQAGKNQTYQKNHVVTVLGQEGNYAKVISGNPIDGNRNVISYSGGLLTYNRDTSYAYVSLDNLTPLNNNKMFNNFGEYIQSITKIDWNDNLLHIEGTAKTENLTDSANAKLLLFGDNVISYNVKSSQTNDTITINKDIDISNLDIGNYMFELGIEYPNYHNYDVTTLISYSELPSLKIIGNKVYSFRIQNGILFLNITEKPINYENLLALSKIKLNVNDVSKKVELYIKGSGAIKGLDSLIAGDTTHQLLLIDLYDPSKVITFDLNNTSAFFSINDGFEYKNVGFEGTIVLDDVDELKNGSYILAIKTSNSGASSIGYIKTINSSYDNLVVKNSDSTTLYRLMIDDYNLNTFQLDIENVHDEIDYSSIKKPEQRTSLSNITRIKFVDSDDSKLLKINGAAMIYYLDYDNNDDLTYTTYLYDTKNDKLLKMDTSKTANKYNYQENYRSSYNMDNISYEAVIDVNDIEIGDYRIIVEVINRKNDVIYKDYVDLMQFNDTERDSLDYNNKHYSFYASNIKNRLFLRVEDK